MTRPHDYDEPIFGVWDASKQAFVDDGGSPVPDHELTTWAEDIQRHNDEFDARDRRLDRFFIGLFVLLAAGGAWWLA